jgi:hypothetical protein
LGGDGGRDVGERGDVDRGSFGGDIASGIVGVHGIGVGGCGR